MLDALEDLYADSGGAEPLDPPTRFVDREAENDDRSGIGDGGDKAGRPRCPHSEKPPSPKSPSPRDDSHRVPPSRYDQGLIAPPSVDPERLPAPFVGCGCGDCNVDPFGNGGTPVTEVCPTPQPMTRGTAREVYRRVVGSNRETPNRTSKVEGACRWYANLLDGDAYLRAEMEGLTTVLVSLRLSPTDENGKVVTPWQLTEDLYANVGAVMDSLRYSLGQKHDFDFEYARITSGTREWVTPHLHIYCWVADPDDNVSPEMFRRPVAKHVERCSRASWDAHDVVNTDAVRIEHDPLLATRCGDDGDGIDGLRDVTPTRGVVYVAQQMPHLALAGATEPWEIDRAVAAWVSSRQWVSTSEDFPDYGDVQAFKETDP